MVPSGFISQIKRDISQIFHTFAFDAAAIGSSFIHSFIHSSEYYHMTWHGKTRMAWLPDVDKCLICLLVSTRYTNVSDAGRTDGQTDRHRTTA